MPDGSLLAQTCEDAVHRRLAAFNRVRMTPCLPEDFSPPDPALYTEEARILECARARVAEAASQAPCNAAAFVAWFAALERTGPGQGDPLFPWLAAHAPLDALRWFLAQEVAGEAGFEDLTALVQVRMPMRPKLELARNFWDEMGHGRAPGMHGPMLEKLAASLCLKLDPGRTVWQSLALANTMAGLAANRRYAFHAIGALGVIELTAPGRAAMVAAGLKRLRVPNADRHYFDLHAVLDVKHSASWNAEIIAPLVAEDPRRAQAIAEGALMRLEAGAACFARYREELNIPARSRRADNVRLAAEAEVIRPNS